MRLEPCSSFVIPHIGNKRKAHGTRHADASRVTRSLSGCCQWCVLSFVVSGRGRGRRVESHQRVAMTRWWSFWAMSRAEGDGKPPTSLDDSLVVFFWPGTRVEGHQRVAMTHCWSFWERSRVEGDGKPPTSLDDSLVVFFGQGRGWRDTNESR